MIKKSCGVLAAALLLGLSSCSDVNPWLGEAGQGAIRLNLSADGSVKDAIPQTRADGVEAETLFEVPEASDFNIHLAKTDGSWSRTYLHDDFLGQPGFSTGSYSLRAFSGENEKEGFECPYFEGTAEITVLEGKETVAEIIAKVANSLISVTYSDAFKAYMKSYSAGVHSSGGSYFEISESETRPLFVNPGDVKLSVSFTNPQNQSLTLQPAEFKAEAGCHYHVNYNVNSDIATPRLEIEFEDGLTVEKVEIDLTDELFTSPAPEVVAVGFNEGETLEFLAGEAPEKNCQFKVLSYGGLKSVMMTLNVISGSFDPGFSGDVELMEADASVQQKLSSLGIDCKGLFRNPDKMALIDFTQLPKHLPSGEYELSVRAKDNLDRASDAVSIRFTAVAPELTVTPQNAIYGLNTGSLLINYNGSNPATDITFKALNQYGTMVDAKVLGCDLATRTRAIEGKNYIFTIDLPDTERSSIPVEVYLYGKLVKTVDLEVVVPSYNVLSDAFAGKVVLKIDADADQLAVITEKLKIYKGGSQVTANVNRDKEAGLITISGLTPAQAYKYTVSLLSASEGQKEIEFTTEAATDVANGGFDQTEETINATINSGGRYKAGSSNSNWTYNTADVKASVPLRSTGWATLNELTYYTGSSNVNTWFMVPSAYMDGDAVAVRSVGYSHDGVNPADQSNGGLSANYYNGLAPSGLTNVAGELFLGSYTFTGSPVRVDGIEFKSRPSSVTFSYKYAPYGSEQGEAYVAVLDASGKTISSATKVLGAADSFNDVTVDLPAYAFGEKAATLIIRFKSTQGSAIGLNIPSGNALNERYDADNSVLNAHVSPPAGKGFHVPDNLYKAKATGSVLTIDNVKLNY